MAHKKSYRLGWQSENLARFILYKFSFIAHPTKVADDIGVDFFCTLFETQKQGRNTDLIPKNSFAIQIKSDAKGVNISKYLRYLESLETPFFIGVVDRKKLSLVIYSGEYLTLFFSYKGTPQYLKAELCNRDKIAPNQWFSEVKQGYTLKFPHIATITADMDDNALETEVKSLWEICSLMRDNIASRINREYTFKIFDSEEPISFFGPDSFKYIHKNLFFRIADIFNNLKWLGQHEQNRQITLEEFRLYEDIYFKLVSAYSLDKLPQHLQLAYNSAKSELESFEKTIEVD